MEQSECNIRRQQPPPRFFCATCRGTNVMVTAWVYMNSNQIADSDGPTDQIWCPDCDAEVTVEEIEPPPEESTP